MLLRLLVIVSALLCTQITFADGDLSMPRIPSIYGADWLESSQPNMIKQLQKEDILIELFKETRTASEMQDHPIYAQISAAMYTEDSLHYNDWLLAVRSMRTKYPEQTLNFVSLQQNKWLDEKFPLLEADLDVIKWEEAVLPSLFLTATAIYSIVHFKNKGAQKLTSGIPKTRSLKLSRRILQQAQRRLANQVGRHGLRNSRYAGTSLDNNSGHNEKLDETKFTKEFIPISPAQFVYSQKGAHSMGLGYEDFQSFNKIWGLSSGLIAIYAFDKINFDDNEKLKRINQKIMSIEKRGFLARNTAKLLFKFPLFKLTAGFLVSIAFDKGFTWTMEAVKEYRMDTKFTDLKNTLLNASFDSKVQAYSFLDTYSVATQELASYHTHPVWAELMGLMTDYHKRYYCNNWNMKKVAGLDFYNVEIDESSYPEKLNKTITKNKAKLQTITHLYNESIHNISQFKGLDHDAYTNHLVTQLKLQRENIQPENLRFILDEGLKEIRQEVDQILEGDELYTYQEIAKDLNCIGVSDLRNFIIKKNEK